jgi:hypothetical protein
MSVFSILNRHRLEENIETDLKEIGSESADWIQLALDRV